MTGSARPGENQGNADDAGKDDWLRVAEGDIVAGISPVDAVRLG